jgi:hypothetical protein
MENAPGAAEPRCLRQPGLERAWQACAHARTGQA